MNVVKMNQDESDLFLLSSGSLLADSRAATVQENKLLLNLTAFLQRLTDTQIQTRPTTCHWFVHYTDSTILLWKY